MVWSKRFMENNCWQWEIMHSLDTCLQCISQENRVTAFHYVGECKSKWSNLQCEDCSVNTEKILFMKSFKKPILFYVEK